MRSSIKQEKFISTIIENFKNPTIAQIKALELFLNSCEKKINPEEKDLIELTLNSCNNMQKMLENYTMISKIGYEKLNLDYKYFNIAELINSIVQNTNVLIKYLELKLEVSIKPDMEIYADKFKIKRAIENLISYTFNSAYKNSNIKINLEEYKNTVKFEIISNGINEDFKEILQIFKQSQGYNPKYTELFITKEIVKAHFGKIIFKIMEDYSIIGFQLPVK